MVIVEHARSMENEMVLPNAYQGEAINIATYLLNGELTK